MFCKEHSFSSNWQKTSCKIVKLARKNIYCKVLNIKITKPLVWNLEYLCVWKEFLPKQAWTVQLSSKETMRCCHGRISLRLYWQIIVYIVQNCPIQRNHSVMQHFHFNQIYISANYRLSYIIFCFFPHSVLSLSSFKIYMKYPISKYQSLRGRKYLVDNVAWKFTHLSSPRHSQELKWQKPSE